MHCGKWRGKLPRTYRGAQSLSQETWLQYMIRICIAARTLSQYNYTVHTIPSLRMRRISGVGYIPPGGIERTCWGKGRGSLEKNSPARSSSSTGLAMSDRELRDFNSRPTALGSTWRETELLASVKPVVQGQWNETEFSLYRYTPN